MIMAQYNWIDVQDENVPSLIEKINEQSTLKLFSEDRSHVEMAELPFYKNFKLVQATTFSSIPPVTMQYLVAGSAPNWDVIKLNGTRDPIFENNARAGLVLNAETVVAYATFVLGAVQTEQGSLRLVEKVDDETFTNTPTPEQRKTVTRLIRPAKVEETADGFKLDVIMLYGDSVYRAELDVKKDGFIEITKEETLAEGMPIRPIFLE